MSKQHVVKNAFAQVCLKCFSLNENYPTSKIIDFSCILRVIALLTFAQIYEI